MSFVTQLEIDFSYLGLLALAQIKPFVQEGEFEPL